MAGVDGEDPVGTAGEQDAREPAGRGADVERDAAPDPRVEGVQRGCELRLTPERRGAAHDHRRVGSDPRVRVRDRRAAHGDPPLLDRCADVRDVGARGGDVFHDVPEPGAAHAPSITRGGEAAAGCRRPRSRAAASARAPRRLRRVRRAVDRTPRP